MKHIFAFLDNFPETFKYFPVQHEMKKLSRQWIVNIAYSIVGKPLSDWVMERINERNQDLQVKKNLLIDLDPEIAQIF